MREAAEELTILFDGLRRAHGTYRLTKVVDERGKQGGRAVTVLGPPGPDLWVRHLEGEVGLGVVPINEENACRWGAIDIDEYKGIDHTQIEDTCKRLDFPLVICKSKSGGAHLYLFTQDFVPASLIRRRLEQMAVALGYRGVEVFPKQIKLAGEKDTGNWLNMPFFGATRPAVIGGEEVGVEAFLRHAKQVAITLNALEAMQVQAPGGKAFRDGPPCLQYLAEHRVSAGARNEVLFAMGVYARMKWPDEWEEKLDVANRDFLAVPLPSAEVSTLIKSLTRKNYFYPCNKPGLAQHCQKDICRNRELGVGQDDEDVGLNIGSLIKIKYATPIWIIDVEGIRVELETADLMDQRRFMALCVEKLNMWPAPVKPAAWRRMIQEKLSNVEEQDAPEDVDPSGRLRWYVEQFCTAQSPARTREELLLGKPWAEEGRHYFRSPDLLKYLEQQHFRDMKPRQIWTKLREMGAAHRQFNLRGKCVQCWSVPEQTNRVQEEQEVEF